MSKNKKDGGLILLFTIIFLIVVFAFSWGIACGIIKLITMCFGWQFK